MKLTKQEAAMLHIVITGGMALLKEKDFNEFKKMFHKIELFLNDNTKTTN